MHYCYFRPRAKMGGTSTRPATQEKKPEDQETDNVLTTKTSGKRLSAGQKKNFVYSISFYEHFIQ